MPGALRRDPQSAGRGRSHQLDDFVRERRIGDGGGTVVDPEVPGTTSLVVLPVAR